MEKGSKRLFFKVLRVGNGYKTRLKRKIEACFSGVLLKIMKKPM